MLLGIELDTVSQERRIDPTRLAEIIDLLEAWSTKQHCTKRQLQSLIGNLNFIHTVCRPGRTFLRRMLDVLCQEPITWSLHTCCTLESTLSDRELFLEEAFPRN